METNGFKYGNTATINDGRPSGNTASQSDSRVANLGKAVLPEKKEEDEKSTLSDTAGAVLFIAALCYGVYGAGKLIHMGQKVAARKIVSASRKRKGVKLAKKAAKEQGSEQAKKAA